MISSFDAHRDLSTYLGDPTVARALRAWAHDHALTVATPSESWRRHGGSGALLARVRVTDVAGDHRSSDLLLKVCSPGSPAGEAENHEKAWQLSPAFARHHLFRQVFPARVLRDGRVLMFLGSSDSLANDKTLGELPNHLLMDCATATIRLILEEWNVGAKRWKSATVAELAWLELRGALDKGRSAYDWTRRAGFSVVGPSTDAPLHFGDRSGPLASLLRRGSEIGRMNLRYVYGNTHGDLHLDNVIVPFMPDGVPDFERIRLIDLSGFSPSAPLTRDLATLLLSCVLRAIRAGITAAEASTLLDSLTSVRPTPGDSYRVHSLALSGALDVLYSLRSAALAHFEVDVRPALHSQYLVSLIAQALIYTSYGNVGHEWQEWYFQLAVSAAEKFIAFCISDEAI
jgi:hypothetical protein